MNQPISTEYADTEELLKDDSNSIAADDDTAAAADEQVAQKGASTDAAVAPMLDRRKQLMMRQPTPRRCGSRSPMRSVSPKPSCNNHGFRNAVWNAESMTSFKVSRRSIHESNEASYSYALSASCSSIDEFQASTATFNTLILEDPTNNTRTSSEEEKDDDKSIELTTEDIADNANNNSEDSPPLLTPTELKVAWLRITSGNVVNSAPVQLFMSVLIVANAAILGTITFQSVRENEKALHILESLDLAILVAFTVEILLHLAYLGFWKLVKDSWLLFDIIVILLSWCFLGSSLAILRSFRIFRIFSLVSRWESLRLLFEAVGSTIPKMASIWLSLLIIFYIYAVLFTTLFSELYVDGELGYYDIDYFGRLDKTFVTLFQIMTLDNWSDVARQTMEYQPWSFLGFFIFIVFSSFFVVNLVVAVICESLMQMSRGPPSALDGPDAQELLQLMLKRQEDMATAIQQLQKDVKTLAKKDE